MSRLSRGFAAGFAATIAFHQTALLLLHFSHLISNPPFDFHPVAPLGVPKLISLAFWGGVWGVAFSLSEGAIARSRCGYWAGAVGFGAILPTVFSWLVVAPLKGLPLGYGFRFSGVLTGLIVNGAWGFGTALFLRLMSRSPQPA